MLYMCMHLCICLLCKLHCLIVVIYIFLIRLDSKCSFNQALYTSFTALHDQDLSMAAKALHVARQQSVRTVSLSSLECVRNVYPTLCQLHTVTQAEDVLRMANRYVMQCHSGAH